MGGGVAEGLAQRASGLYVPKDATLRTMPEADFVKLRRALKLAKENLMVAAFFCRECKQPIALEQVDRLIQGVGGKAGGGRIELTCGCTTWSVR